MKAAFISLDQAYSTGQATAVPACFLLVFLSGTKILLKRQDII